MRNKKGMHVKTARIQDPLDEEFVKAEALSTVEVASIVDKMQHSHGKPNMSSSAVTTAPFTVKGKALRQHEEINISLLVLLL
jgi:hypothetical protein